MITKNIVPENQRLAITEKLFGINFPLRLEPLIYNLADRMASEYDGGYWEFHELGKKQAARKGIGIPRPVLRR